MINIPYDKEWPYAIQPLTNGGWVLKNLVTGKKYGEFENWSEAASKRTKIRSEQKLKGAQ